MFINYFRDFPLGYSTFFAHILSLISLITNYPSSLTLPASSIFISKIKLRPRPLDFVQPLQGCPRSRILDTKTSSTKIKTTARGRGREYISHPRKRKLRGMARLSTHIRVSRTESAIHEPVVVFLPIARAL